MSAPVRSRRIGVHDVQRGKPPLVCLTAYSASCTRLLDPHADLLPVADSQRAPSMH